jgi:hypothetical protein
MIIILKAFAQDKTKVVHHHLAEDQTATEAKEGLIKYISQFGKPPNSP